MINLYKMFKSFQNLAFGYIEHEARIKELEKGVFNKGGNTNTNTNIDDKTILTIKNFNYDIFNCI